ncbi:unnamed protein product [Anisakis simplex]|uniref:Regulatory protein zeste n=1 Tax=Anisakis simplex TaxID=6269 RepID=A0A0M3JWF1_ANISI|nr:unnamed protein product [Anisakis simplex]
MINFKQLASGVTSQLNEMIQEKDKLKRTMKEECDETDAKKSRVDEADSVQAEVSSEQQESSEAGNEASIERSLSPFNTSDMVHANAKTLAQVFGSTNTNNQSAVTSSDINRMNRERGLEIVSMASRYEALVDSASRSPAANMERNKIWHQITDDINKKYPHLNMLTFEQCKKLCKYYKRKDPAHYGLSLNRFIEEQAQERKLMNSKSSKGDYARHYDETIDDSEILEANDIVDGICKDVIGAADVVNVDATAEESIIREDDKPSNDLLEFLAQCSASTSVGAATSADGLLAAAASSAPQSSLHPSSSFLSQQKKERIQFVYKLAETFGTIFESQSRSYQINAERNQVWKQIADVTNDKYSNELGDLTVDQTKKLYANYKRKCQYSMMRNAQKLLSASSSDDTNFTNKQSSSTNGSNSVDVDSDASSSNSELLSRLVSPNSLPATRNAQSPSILSKLISRDRINNANNANNNTTNTTSKSNGDTPKNGVNTNRTSSNASSLSTVELLALIADRDAEIKQLRNELLQKSVEHQLQISKVVEKMSDLIKVAVNANVQREIISSLGATTFAYGTDTFLEKVYDDENDL